ncbi:hypothetical protein [Roseibium alexandrii]|uniref:hypothetical protein n=1 Tax=Roseibium alexandrii TaxID=388408 RepID=UPI003750F01C
MTQRDFMKHLLSGSPQSPIHQPLSRVYKNNHDIDTVIALPRGYWEYVDFLESRLEISFLTWVRHCDRNPFEDWSLSELLMYWLWLDQCHRFYEGLPTNKPKPPMGYERWLNQEYGREESQKASLRLAEKQKAYETPLPISVILGSVAAFPTNRQTNRPAD